MSSIVLNKTGGKNFFYKYYRIIVIPVVFLVYICSYFILNPYQNTQESLLIDLDWTLDIFLLLLYCAVLTELSLFVGRSLNYWISWQQKPIFRAFAQFICLIAGNILLNYSFSFLWQYFYPWTPLKESELIQIWQSNVMAAILSIFISSIHTGIFLLNRWRITSEEAAQLKIKTAELQGAVTRSELESLKLQLDPHFIFNNFSTLTELIYEDQNAAAAFLENITRVYRYMISNLNRDTISVREEIEFLNAYFYLLKKRLEEKVNLEIEIKPEHLEKHLPTLTLQLLIENAVKHNSATNLHPLTIFIYSEENDIVVKNNMQTPSGKKMVSTGIGHKNIEFRYKILSDRMPDFYISKESYFARLPLI
ncbi:histidine kinase [Flavobacterium sp. F-65]|uniref:Histidine kinase n=1 Tax=Flavobacterium pisciphilum TaxID=2893755 RepID=A0ABS8MRK0_9FLAO|nr:histidine kinase [Flavobacterium sp. F-65]MCC9070772.1 histidine kinase [Flavobacterium sp. F-65]